MVIYSGTPGWFVVGDNLIEFDLEYECGKWEDASAAANTVTTREGDYSSDTVAGMHDGSGCPEAGDHFARFAMIETVRL